MFADLRCLALKIFQRISNEGGKAINRPIIAMRASTDMYIAITNTLYVACRRVVFRQVECLRVEYDVMKCRFPSVCFGQRDLYKPLILLRQRNHEYYYLRTGKAIGHWRSCMTVLGRTNQDQSISAKVTGTVAAAGVIGGAGGFWDQPIISFSPPVH